MKMDTRSFGYWVRRQRMALDLTQAALARQVGCATITIKKIEREERRPSQIMAERLAESLAIPETERAGFIKIALGEMLPENFHFPTQPNAPYPPELGHEPLKHTDIAWDRFVGRERELAWLDAHMYRMMQGEGKIVFIAGDAGRGKTALMVEFARRMAKAHPDLIVSGGICSAYTGIGDPFLPFREILGFLTGDVETHWMANTFNRLYGQRVWQALPQILQVLVEHAPNLLEVLVPGTALLSRASAVAPGGAPWLAQLQSEVIQRRKAASVPDQNTVFGQVNSLLSALSRVRPLLIVLDDLHWADEASIRLLFHLARHVTECRVFILGSYRPEEFVSDPSAGRRLFENILGELKQSYGDIILDLTTADQSGGRQFINAYLKILPNQFGPGFHQALYRQTGGHPLFTVEFIREMQAHGDLMLDDTGKWREAENIDWNNLPSRVEAVIAQRLARLDPEQTHILNVACVEGEQFNAEVVAHVLNIPEREIFHKLSWDLTKRHQLVQERGEIKLIKRVLSPYGFRHILFQKYLYDQLDPGECRRLHSDVASALEALYQDDIEMIAAQLAWHYQKAIDNDQAVRYIEMAGKRAIRLSGYEEAVKLLTLGTTLIEQDAFLSGQIQRKADILLALGEAQYKAGYLEESLRTYQKAAGIAAEFRFPQVLGQAALGYEECRWRFNFPVEPTRLLLEQALEQLGEVDNLLSTRLNVALARVRMPALSPEQYESLRKQIITTARRENDPETLYDALYLNLWGERQPQHSQDRLEAIYEMIRLAHFAGDINRQLEAVNYLILECLERGDLQSIQIEFLDQLKLIEKAHIPFYKYFGLSIKTTLAIMMGKFEEGERLSTQLLHIGRQMNLENEDGIYGLQLFTIRREQGRLNEVAPMVKIFVDQNSLEGTWRPGLALIYRDLDLRNEAEQAFEIMVENNFANIPKDALWLTCIAYLSEVCAYLNDHNRAAQLYQMLLPYQNRALVTGYFGVCYGAVDRYLGMLAATLCQWAVAQGHFDAALAMNTRLEAWPWLAHTQHAYAEMLLKRRQAEDLERAQLLLNSALESACVLGMRSLVEKIRITKGEINADLPD